MAAAVRLGTFVPPQVPLGDIQQRVLQNFAALQAAMVPAPSLPGGATLDVTEQPLLSKESLRKLMRQVDSEQKLDVDVEDLLIDVASDFVQKVTQACSRLAKHRHATVIEARDAQLHLDRNYDLRCGLGEELMDSGRRRKGPPQKTPHSMRVQHVRDAIRKASAVKRSERLRAKRRT
ncbi:Transcription initiation factor TFIID subunit 12 [Polyrhizophydium stewartii]|uniref:Transcription initiation factor TFIID subunit 12 n=1 Tax=Polyrhizophydium stewartii TaxID=2732419 RepID=A0ABR4N1J0_9FUNG